MDPLFKTLYTASMYLQIFPSLSMVCPVDFTDLLLSSLTLSSSSGSGIYVYGTSITTNASGTQVPTWSCLIDNVLIDWFSAASTSENNWIFCSDFRFPDGPHLLTVRANVSDQQTLWFDQIQYQPSASVSPNQSLLRIDSSDSAIQYGSGWQTLESLVQPEGFYINISYTQINGTSLTYQFSGS